MGAATLAVALIVAAIVGTGGGGHRVDNAADSSSTSGPTTSVASTSTTVPLPATTDVAPSTTLAPVEASVPAAATNPSQSFAPPSGQSLVTPALEQQIVQTTWKTFATGFATGDTNSVDATSTPSVQQAVTGTFHCGCGGWPVASTTVNYSAPEQTNYPLYFYAELQGQDFNGQPMVKEAAFSQAATGQAWPLAYLGAYVNGSPVFGTASSDSVADPPF